MSTEQRLTEEQVEVLFVLETLENYMYESSPESTMNDLISQLELGSGKGLSEKGNDIEILDALEYYGYIDSDRTLTPDGKQYIKLLREALEKTDEKENVSMTIDNKIVLINIEKVYLGINNFINKIIDNSELGKAVANGLNNIIKKWCKNK